MAFYRLHFHLAFAFILFNSIFFREHFEGFSVVVKITIKFSTASLSIGLQRLRRQETFGDGIDENVGYILQTMTLCALKFALKKKDIRMCKKCSQSYSIKWFSLLTPVDCERERCGWSMTFLKHRHDELPDKIASKLM